MSEKLLVSPFVKLDPETKEVLSKNPEEKQYILLLYFISNSEDKTFEVITGRTAVREYLIDHIDEIELENSYVLVEDVPFKDTVEKGITAYKFLKLVSKYYDDDFNVDEYYDYDLNPTAEDLNDNIVDPHSYYDPMGYGNQEDI